MVEVWEMVSVVFLGLFAMGNIDNIASSSLDVGSYGTSTGEIGGLFFFLFVFAVVAIMIRSYFSN